MPYLTGDEPDGECNVSIIIPNDARIRQALVGAISELSYAHMWESFGSISPTDTASLMLAAFSTLQIDCTTEEPLMLVSAYRNTGMTVQDNVTTRLTGLSTVQLDTGQWDSDNDRVIIDQDGLYISAVWARSPVAQNNLSCHILVNSTEAFGNSWVSGAGQNAVQTVPGLLPLADGDVLEFWVTLRGTTTVLPAFGKLGFLIFRLGNLS